MIPVTPKATATSVDTNMLTIIHLKIIATVITRNKTVAFTGPLNLSISFEVFPPDARLLNAPK